jgi:hypothetical protein
MSLESQTSKIRIPSHISFSIFLPNSQRELEAEYLNGWRTRTTTLAALVQSNISAKDD